MVDVVVASALATIGATEAGSLAYIYVHKDWLQPNQQDGILHSVLAAIAGFLYWDIVLGMTTNIGIWELFGAAAVGVLPTSALIAFVKKYIGGALGNGATAPKTPT